MGFFDNREKELEAIINQYKSEHQNLNIKITELNKIKNNQENEIKNLTKRICNEGNKSTNITSKVIQIFIHLLGFSLLTTSLLFAKNLISIENANEWPEYIWELYIFSQFSGLYLLRYGTPTTLRSMMFFGIYMTTLLAILIGFFVFSLINNESGQIGINLILLSALNSIGIPILIYVERHT